MLNENVSCECDTSIILTRCVPVWKGLWNWEAQANALEKLHARAQMWTFISSDPPRAMWWRISPNQPGSSVCWSVTLEVVFLIFLWPPHGVASVNQKVHAKSTSLKILSTKTWGHLQYSETRKPRKKQHPLVPHSHCTFRCENLCSFSCRLSAGSLVYLDTDGVPDKKSKGKRGKKMKHRWGFFSELCMKKSCQNSWFESFFFVFFSRNERI